MNHQNISAAYLLQGEKKLTILYKGVLVAGETDKQENKTETEVEIKGSCVVYNSLMCNHRR